MVDVTKNALLERLPTCHCILSYDLVMSSGCNKIYNMILLCLNRNLTGSACSDPCPEGTFGPQCRGRCDGCDPDTQTCDHVTGDCICKPGKRGQGCAKGRPTVNSLCFVVSLMNTYMY